MLSIRIVLLWEPAQKLRDLRAGVAIRRRLSKVHLGKLPKRHEVERGWCHPPAYAKNPLRQCQVPSLSLAPRSAEIMPEFANIIPLPLQCKGVRNRTDTDQLQAVLGYSDHDKDKEVNEVKYLTMSCFVPLLNKKKKRNFDGFKFILETVCRLTKPLLSVFITAITKTYFSITSWLKEKKNVHSNATLIPALFNVEVMVRPTRYINWR